MAGDSPSPRGLIVTHNLAEQSHESHPNGVAHEKPSLYAETLTAEALRSGAAAKPQRRTNRRDTISAVRQSLNRTARSVWSAWSLLPLSSATGQTKREQAPRTPY